MIQPVDVREPKELSNPTESTLIAWAKEQLQIAAEIVDNPGGGLLFAAQACGQVRAALAEEDAERWAPLGEILLEAEDAAVRRRFEHARELISRARVALG